MEELRSTAIIDSEILEDSRKKAERILSNSETECKAILAAVKERVAEVTKEKTHFYDERIEIHKRDLAAAMPLERKRYLVEFEKNEVLKAIVEYLGNLSKDKKLQLIKSLFIRYKDYLEGCKVRIKVAGFKTEDILSLIKADLKSDLIIECVEMDAVLKSSLKTEYGEAEGMIIESEDKSRLCRVFIGELIDQIIDKNSYELTTALFCGRLPE